MRIMDQHINWSPEWPKEDVVNLHKRLLRDEFNEVMEVLDGPHNNRNDSLPKLACELADLMFVTYGAALAMGISLDEVFVFIAQNNLHKVTGETDADGKRLKPAHHVDPVEVVKHFPQFEWLKLMPDDDEGLEYETEV